MRRGQIPRALNAKIITDKRLIFLICKGFLYTEKVKDNNPIEKTGKKMNRQFTKEYMVVTFV